MKFSRAGDQKSPIIQFKQIGSLTLWPKADSGNACLFEAINITGPAMFGLQWTGSELFANSWPLTPFDDEASAVAAITKAPPPIRPIGSVPRSIAYTNSTGANSSGNPPGPFDAHVIAQRAHGARMAFNMRLAADKADFEADLHAVDRLTKVAEWLAQQCRDGTIQTKWRATGGGRLTPLEAASWNLEAPLYQIFAAGGFAQLLNGVKVNGYVFMARADLEKATAMLAHASSTVAQADLSRVSPYLQFAIKLSLAKGYCAPKAVTEEARRQDITDAWAQAFPEILMTKSQIDTLVNVTGWPNPDAIRRGARGGQRKKGSTQQTL